MESNFFRVRLAPNCTTNTKIVNGVKLTKNWLTKIGKIERFSIFKDVQTQPLQKQGNNFVPIEKATETVDPLSDHNLSDMTNKIETTDSGIFPSNFEEWNEDQLKSYLKDKDVSIKEIRSLSKSELIEKVNFINSQQG